MRSSSPTTVIHISLIAKSFDRWLKSEEELSIPGLIYELLDGPAIMELDDGMVFVIVINAIISNSLETYYCGTSMNLISNNEIVMLEEYSSFSLGFVIFS